LKKQVDVMDKRFVSIWFRYMATDWFALRNPHLKKQPFVLRTPVHGRMIVTGTNSTAERLGIFGGMVLADARAVVPDLEVMDDQPDLIQKVLKRLGEWCIRFTPFVAIDLPDGLFFDATGCSHLWGGDDLYLKCIIKKLNDRGYDVQAAIADTPGAAWAVARFGKAQSVIPVGGHIETLSHLPPESLRIEKEVADRLHKLGLRQMGKFINMPRPSMRRRFGQQFLSQLDKALGYEMEVLESLQIIESYQERLPCLEPIVTAIGIEMALKKLLETLCLRLREEQKGLRSATLKCYRVDGKVEQIGIMTNSASHHVSHLYKLFEIKLPTIEPALGIELFVLEASKVEDHFSRQEKMWTDEAGLNDERLSELVDNLTNKLGANVVHRFVPDEHYWPERSFRPSTSLQEKLVTPWRNDLLRPLQLLPKPEPIEVTAPIPDYPPMLFRYGGKLHKIIKADGPERIEQEWWLQQGQHRDYYRVEDELGNRYWLFRLGHYDDKTFKWFLHGYFP